MQNTVLETKDMKELTEIPALWEIMAYKRRPTVKEPTVQSYNRIRVMMDQNPLLGATPGHPHIGLPNNSFEISSKDVSTSQGAPREALTINGV